MEFSGNAKAIELNKMKCIEMQWNETKGNNKMQGNAMEMLWNARRCQMQSKPNESATKDDNEMQCGAGV